MWWILAATAMAKAPTNLTAGEQWGYWTGWTGNAYTVPKKMVVLHPWIRSGVGVTDQWDLKASIIGELLGPQISTEVAFVENPTLAASLEARAQMGWGFNSVDYGFVPHFSVHSSDTVMFDVSFGILGQGGSEQIKTSEGNVILQKPGIKALRPELGVELQANETLWFVLTARSDLLGWKTNGPHGVLGAYLMYGKGPVGLDLGINLAVLGLEGFGQDVANFEDDIGVDIWNPPAAVPLPLPVFNFWFRI